MLARCAICKRILDSDIEYIYEFLTFNRVSIKVCCCCLIKRREKVESYIASINTN